MNLAKLAMASKSNNEPPSSTKKTLTQFSSSYSSPNMSVNRPRLLRKAYDVFINHRGLDAKHSLAYHMYDLLRDRGVEAFFDIREMEPGEPVPLNIQHAVSTSKAQVAILSLTYGESSWCLDELSMMMAKHRDGSSVVFPIFYQVEPCEVAEVSGEFGNKFYGKHSKRVSHEKIEEWKHALKEVTMIPGFLWEHHKGALVKLVVNKVCKAINKGLLEITDKVIGIEDLLSEKEDQIMRHRQESSVVTVVEISGIGGIGKTTFGKALYNNLLPYFERFCFIADVKGMVEKHGILHVQSMLLKELFNLDLPFLTLSQGKQLLKERLHGKEVLILLDNIDDRCRVSDFFIEDSVPLLPSSVIIVTSRVLGVVKDDIGICKCCKVNQVQIPRLRSSDSKELFIQHACGSSGFMSDEKLEDLVDKIVKICDGVPLALILFGRQVYGRDFSYWQTFWKAIKNYMPTDLRDGLHVTYASLDTELERQLFLDVAIFFHGDKANLLRNIWEDDPNEDQGKFTVAINKLERKLLIKVNDFGSLEMHDILRDLGKAIVDRENELNPGSRSRLWRPHEVKRVLSQQMGTENVQGLSLVLENSLLLDEDEEGDPCPWKVDAFTSMSSLRILMLQGHCVDGDLSQFPRRLLFLRWKYFPYDSIHIPLKLARVVELYYGDQTSLWDHQGKDVPVNLRNLKLQRCYKLQKIPEWTKRFRLLGQIEISDCHALKNIPESFSLLEGLERLNIRNCRTLELLPEKFGQLKNLLYLNVSGCRKLREFTKSIGELQRLEYLFVDGCNSIISIPEDLGLLKQLLVLSMNDCSRLEYLPDIFDLLERLETLGIANCNALKRLPSSFGNLPRLKKLYIKGCKRLEFNGEWLGTITSPEAINLDDCIRLRKFPDQLMRQTRLKRLYYADTKPQQIYALSRDSFWGIQELPENIGDLCTLRTLQFSGLLQKALPQSTSCLLELRELNLYHCLNLEALPDSISNLHNLVMLWIEDCPKLQYLPITIGDLPQMSGLIMLECPIFKGFPSSITRLSRLKNLGMRECGMVEIIDATGFLELQRLEVTSCVHLKKILGLLSLKDLTWVEVDGCVELVDIGDFCTGRKNMQMLSTNGCQKITPLNGLHTVRISFELAISLSENLLSDNNIMLQNLPVSQVTKLNAKYSGLASSRWASIVTNPRCLFFRLQPSDTVSNKWVAEESYDKIRCIGSALCFVSNLNMDRVMPQRFPPLPRALFNIDYGRGDPDMTYEHWHFGSIEMVQFHMAPFQYPCEMSIDKMAITNTTSVSEMVNSMTWQGAFIYEGCVKEAWVCYLLEGEEEQDIARDVRDSFISECRKLSLSTTCSEKIIFECI